MLAGWPDDYIAGLNRFCHLGPADSPHRSTAAQEWLRTFSSAVLRSCRDAQAYANQIDELNDQWRTDLGAVRAKSTLDALLRLLPGTPLLTAQSAARLTERSAVGAGIGALVGGAVWLGVAVNLPPLAAGALGVGAGLLATGAFHEDGLADACDGLGAGRSRARMLEIMRDPRLGTFGVAALIISLILQASALAALPVGMVIPAAAAAHSSSRSWPAAAMFLPPASPNGLAASFQQAAGKGARILCFLLGLVIAAALLRSAAWVMLPAGAAGALFTWWATRRLGGVTGDILGAVQQTTLVATLLALAAWWNG